MTSGNWILATGALLALLGSTRWLGRLGAWQWLDAHLIGCWREPVIGEHQYSARIICDSLSPAGTRLTTWVLTYWRAVHAELMTHRVFSRNAASSRAIPIWKMILQVAKAPAHPLWWGANQAGMQAKAELTGWRLRAAQQVFFQSRWLAIAAAWVMWKLGLHKQLVNRVLEPWMWITVVVSATEYGNWFWLRDHPDAQPEIAWVAGEMNKLYHHEHPKPLAAGMWHLPFIGHEGDELLSEQGKIEVATGRAARVSYLTHDGRRDVGADIGLHNKLQGGSGGIGHWSPFEHVAQAKDQIATERANDEGNFRGFRQYRKTFANEHHARYVYVPR